MLSVENYTIIGNTYNIKEQLKNLGCYWDKNEGKYKCDKHTVEAVEKLLNEVNENTNRVMRTAWDKAMQKYDLTVCPKTHPLYSQVLASFKDFKQQQL